MTNTKWNNLFNNTFKDIIKNIKNNYKLDLDKIYGLIDKRIDYTHLKIYSIDPLNCTDADDAFSIYKENDYLHLIIHIADPTSYFNPNDEIFNDIISNGTTIYLSNKEPDHLFPENILNKSSLTDGIKNVVMVHTILKPHYKPSEMYKIIKTTIEYGIINCDNGKRFTYEEAAEELYNNNILLLGMNIAQFFYNKRNINNDPKGHINSNFIFSDAIFVIPKVIDNEIVLKEDTKEVQIMKAMIGEFAIHSNTIFAQGLNDDNLFLRSLKINTTDTIDTILSIDYLIKEGISAKYINNKVSHDLIGSYYTHSTSPLRRTSDCIVHFLLKAKYLQIDSPFSNDELKLYANKLNIRTKEMKNIQFKDIKLRTFQWIAEELECRLNSIKITVKFMSYKAPFLNLMITKIDSMNVNIPYTIKRKEYKEFNQEIINITKINLYNKFDEGTLPEIDILFK
jgi:exoribonuclease R